VAALQASAMFAAVVLGVVEPWHLVAGNLVLGIVSACDAAGAPVDPGRAGRRQERPAQRNRAQSAMMNAARFIGR